MAQPAAADFGAVEPQKQSQQPGAGQAAAQSHGQAQEANLNRLTEEQREEINEAVS